MKRSGEYRFGVGVPTLLMLCVVLALTTLGVLTYAGGKSSLSLTDRSVDMTVAYYDAAASAQEQLARIDERLADFLGQASDDASYDALISAYAEQNGMEYARDTLSFTRDAGGGRTLGLAVEIAEYGADGARFTLTRHTLSGEELVEEEERTLNLYH